MYACGTCRKAFPAGFTARDNHCFSTGHRSPEFECDACVESFEDNFGRSEHMKWLGHWIDSKYKCNFCLERFNCSTAQREHEVNYHHHCRDCDRTFNNLNNIKQHLNSSTHRGTDIACPFCHQAFATATGVTHHVERGSCPNARNINRDGLYTIVRSKDPEGRISKKFIGWTGSGSYKARGNTWNGRAFECYFCDREFNQIHGLNQHLDSPVHQQKLYHCPGPRCSREFTSLASIINHLESEVCGFVRFEEVQESFGDIIIPGCPLPF